ncbi:MAG: NAD(P)H-dependent oxidoreductase [Oceanicaulis sp.]
MSRILRIDASGRTAGSVSRDLSDRLARRLAGRTGAITVRDLAAAPPAFVSEAWIGANFTDPAARTGAQRAELAASDMLVEEIEAADQIVIGVPVYNFAIPAVLKAWVDMIARARRTFRYTENGPEGLLKGKTAWLVVASGGTPVESEIDFATPYLKHVLGFVGITDVRVVDAGLWGSRSQAEQAAAIEALEEAASTAT